MSVVKRVVRVSAHWRAVRLAAIGIAVLLALGGFVPAVAEHTRFWRQSDYDNFDRGTAKGTAVRSDGRIMLAPKFALLADTNLAYLWDLKLDSRGNLYAAGGSNAKVVKVDPTGKTTTAFDSSELSAQALAIDRRDNVYVATSPDGKIYKVTPDGQTSVFFDPQVKYIWALAMGADGTLYAATGDNGKIFSVSPDGKGDVFYAGSETHIRALALDGKGNLLAGTEPSGLILRIPLAAPTAAGGRQAYVLYETARREITSLLADASGNLYVGAIGDKVRTPQGAPQAQPQPQQQTTAFVVQGVPGGGQAQPPANLFQPFPVVNSSAVYRIAADGSPQEMWSSRQDIVYSLGAAPGGAVLLGTGNQGTVIQLDANRVFSQLTESTTGQVTGLVRGANGKTFVATANPGKIFTLGPELETEGTFESQPFDARIFSRWGRLTWWGENATTTARNRFVRSRRKHLRPGEQLESVVWSVPRCARRRSAGARSPVRAVEGGAAWRAQPCAGGLLGQPGVPAQERTATNRRRRRARSGRAGVRAGRRGPGSANCAVPPAHSTCACSHYGGAATDEFRLPQTSAPNRRRRAPRRRASRRCCGAPTT